jgi:hypothetical protein
MRQCACGEPIRGTKHKVDCYKCAEAKRLQRKRDLHAQKKAK